MGGGVGREGRRREGMEGRRWRGQGGGEGGGSKVEGSIQKRWWDKGRREEEREGELEERWMKGKW